MIELYLSSDGKHTVHVTAETREQMDDLAPYARGLYEWVLKQYGTKPQLWEAARNGQTNGHTAAGNQNGARVQAQKLDAPRCPEHDKSMAHRKGRFGAFWSCPTRLADGNWCNHTREVPQPANGQTVPRVSA